MIRSLNREVAIPTCALLPMAVMITGAFCLAGAVWFTTQLQSIRKVMRPIYIEMGIVKNGTEPSLEDQVGR